MNKQPYTILVIDDEATIRATLEALLDKPNYRVEMAEDGVKGFERAKQIVPDVILLDVMMPHMNGYDVCKRIRSEPQIAEVPIIMITALDDSDSKLSGLLAGADDFISKPFDTLELEIRLNTLRHVDRYRHLVEEREKLQLTLGELSQKNRQLQILSQQVLYAQENERRRVALELHDVIGQGITGLKLILERKGGDVHSLLAEARAVTNELMQHVREISLDLRPAILDDFGLPAALDDLLKRFTNQTKIAIHHNINPLDERRFNRAIEIASFRVVQEAITNIARHAKVSEAEVMLTISHGQLQISIVDAGSGFDIKSKDLNTTTGLSSMAERVNMAGGHFTLQSTPEKGTLVIAAFELKEGE